jgi:hypothetical protein
VLVLTGRGRDALCALHEQPITIPNVVVRDLELGVPQIAALVTRSYDARPRVVPYLTKVLASEAAAP